MSLDSEFIQNMLANRYIVFLIYLIASFLIAFIAKFIVKKILKPLARKTKTKIDDIITGSISSIIFYFVLLIGIKLGFNRLEFQEDAYNNIVDTVLILLVSVFLIRIINGFSMQWMKEWKLVTKSSADERIIPLLQKILKAVVFILTGFFILTSWRVNISPLLATAGVAGLAIGLAVKDSLANVLGGAQLVLDHVFKVGDKVQLESGELGVIMDIGLRSTKLRTYDNEMIYIPNGYLANSKIKNYTQPDISIRVNVDFGVEYGSDTEKVRRVVIAAVKKVDTVIEEPAPSVEFKEMADSSLNFTARVWVGSYGDAYSTSLKVRDAIYNALKKARIGIPFPTRTIYTKTEE